MRDLRERGRSGTSRFRRAGSAVDERLDADVRALGPSRNEGVVEELRRKDPDDGHVVRIRKLPFVSLRAAFCPELRDRLRIEYASGNNGGFAQRVVGIAERRVTDECARIRCAVRLLLAREDTSRNEPSACTLED